MKQEYRELGKLKIGWDEWTRFEQMSDEFEFLWEMFWVIINDKKEIEDNQICKRGYFELYVIPNLVPKLRFMTSVIEDADDLDIILSLFIQLVPEIKCVDCNCGVIKSEINDYIREDL
tara:strand:+ start:89 stop:442 length:354 start_codon:yes stop_codon:yes gene_type:complete